MAIVINLIKFLPTTRHSHVHDVIFSKSVTGSIDELPKVKLAAENVELVEEVHIHVCDIHHVGPGELATSYCVDCGKLVCTVHEEVCMFCFG